MENNSVRLIGTVKRAAEADSGVLDFCLVVTNAKGRSDFIDCRMTQQSEAYGQLEGFVNEGEEMEITGHLERRTYSDSQRMQGVMVDIRYTTTVVYVDHIIESEE